MKLRESNPRSGRHGLGIVVAKLENDEDEELERKK